MSRPRGHARAAAGGSDPGGPLVMLCVGHRCSALRALAGTEGRVADLRGAVGDTRGGVLVGADCVGGCAVGALAGVAHRDGATGRTGPTVWLTGVHDADRAAALADWIRAGGPERDAEPDVGLPVALVEAVVGLGRPSRIAHRGGS